jgi:hypothetical protein
MGFRTPLEMQRAYEAAKLLAEILDEFNAVRIIAVCDEAASRDSFLFQVAQPELPDDHPGLDLTEHWSQHLWRHLQLTRFSVRSE